MRWFFGGMFTRTTRVEILSSSDNLIPDSARVMRQSGQGGEAQRAQLRQFSDNFKNIKNSQGSAVSFKQWSELDCQQLSAEINYKRTHQMYL